MFSRTIRAGAALALLLASSLVAQPRPPEGRTVTLFQRYGISVPPAWRSGTSMRNAETLYVPPMRTRPREEPRDRKKPKPDEAPITSEAGMLITVETRRDHADALARLASIAAEQPADVRRVAISGWPAIERTYRAPMPEPGDSATGGRIVLFVSTAIALDRDVLRFETMLAPDADPRWADEAAAIGRSLRAPGGNADAAARDLVEIDRRMHLLPGPPAPAPSPGPASKTTPPKNPADQPAPGNTRVQAGFGELEVIASADAQHVVVAANSGWSFSDDSGGSFTNGGGTPCIYNGCDGDPSLALGQSGRMYYSWIGFPTSEGGGHPDGVTDSLSVSTTNGHSWTFLSDAVFCPSSGMGTPCSVPDQEHIAADRYTASGSAQDRVYLAWRNFGSVYSIDLTCSSDGGLTWTAPLVIDAGSDFPRINVGPDSSVYVAYRAGGNMNVRRFSACDAGLAPDPVTTVAAFTMVPCPMTGLDRCNNGNILSSPTVAADDTDGQHVYYAFATNTVAGNEDVMVYDSTNHAASFTRSVRANAAVAGRRFMPWVTSNNGVALVTWYDRRNGTTAATIDRTRFWGARVSVKNGALVATESDVSQVDDAQCDSGWPCGTRAAADANTCPTPQIAGRCYVAATGLGSFSPCSFAAPMCPVGETCNTAGGCPKYGDYNGNAAIAGRRFSAWASATPPPGVIGAPAGINVYADGANIPSDYYIRDWTDTAASFDDGAEPSVRADFWARSDVWNQSTSIPAAPVSGWILGDAPIRGGSNYAFARVSRRHPASTSTPSEDVQVHFLAADYGLGMAFADIGTANATFAAGDTTAITPGVSWTVPMSASIHLCIAAEITGPGGTDAFIPPSLAGNSPGPADPLILADNNKGQRNLQETLSSGTSSEMMAQVGLPANARETPMQLIVRSKNVGGTITALGSEARAPLAEGKLDLGTLKPGEVRFVRIRLEGLNDQPSQIDVAARGAGGTFNGFSLRAQRVDFRRALVKTESEWASVLRRLAYATQSDRALSEAKSIAAALQRRGLLVDPRKDYDARVRSHFKTVSALVTGYVPSPDDRFGVRDALADLRKAIDAGDADAELLAEKELVERLDALLTVNLRTKK